MNGLFFVQINYFVDSSVRFRHFSAGLTMDFKCKVRQAYAKREAAVYAILFRVKLSWAFFD